MDHQSTRTQLIAQSHLFNGTFVDDLYETFLINPDQVSEQWRYYFTQLQRELPVNRPEVPHTPIQARFQGNHRVGKHNRSAAAEIDQATILAFAKKEAGVLRLITGYRFRGHQQAQLDPLQMQERPHVDDLEMSFYGLNESDLDRVFDTGTFYPLEGATLREILARLKQIYCGTVGAEYMHITNTEQKRWLQERLENPINAPHFDVATKRHLLASLTTAQGLEEFLHTQYVGQKRFSLEGSEVLIPVLDELIQRAGATEVKEIIIGMAHRGRLNVLVNILGKRPKDLFAEFEGKVTKVVGSGDVKYHLGFSSDVMTPGGSVHVAMAFNPSHLEIIGPVIEGAVRARQEYHGDKRHNKVLPILIHGDAAFAGQGVVMETLNLSQTRGFNTGGTVHLIINNQIGFTTSDPLDSRSTLYCTDVAKMVQAPILHVNGDDPEAALFVTQLALDYRMTFNRDVVVDLVSYRRHGHNEADEPVSTQPLMYRKIAGHPRTQAIYARKLMEEGIIGPEESELLLQQYRAALRTQEVVSRPVRHDYKHNVNWKPFVGTHWTVPTDTTVSEETFKFLTERLITTPKGFHIDRTVAKILDARRRMGQGEIPLDWGGAEALAFASLLNQGFPIRLSGQDSSRGTFAHRHCVLHDGETGEKYIPLQHLFPNQPKFLPIDSLLSEEAVLAYEYGYSASEPNTLVIWEAQFGDFANNAQVVIDQFISSSESKWQRYTGLVMLLPHGYDGQGPEHSSARLERYLQLCAEDNIQVCNPTTPAQLFHLLRRQMLRPYRKPLIVMTPKSLLRHKRVVSPMNDFTQTQFQPVIDENDPNIRPENVQRIVFCSGKVYYDLLEARLQHNIRDVAIVRLEQLYPYPKVAIATLLARYPNSASRVWVQEEPRNQGAWWFMRAHLEANLPKENNRIEYAGRPSSASPAVGYYHLHHQQLHDLLEAALQLSERKVEKTVTATG